jgi:hypothetical protein
MSTDSRGDALKKKTEELERKVREKRGKKPDLRVLLSKLKAAKGDNETP